MALVLSASQGLPLALWFVFALGAAVLAFIGVILLDGRRKQSNFEPIVGYRTDGTEYYAQRKLIDDCRDMAHAYTLDSQNMGFVDYTARQRPFADIRRHLSDEYLGKLNAPRTLYLGKGGYEPLIEWFLDELDRLEKEWGL